MAALPATSSVVDRAVATEQVLEVSGTCSIWDEYLGPERPKFCGILVFNTRSH